MLETDEIPDPVADDAPSPDDFEAGASVRFPGSHLTDVVAVDYDGGRYCRECANPEYVALCREVPGKLPAGGPVDRGAEVHCPGMVCDNCHRRLEDLTVVHARGACDPMSCSDMTVLVTDPDGDHDDAEAGVLEADDDLRYVVFREDFPPFGGKGDRAYVHEDHIREA